MDQNAISSNIEIESDDLLEFCSPSKAYEYAKYHSPGIKTRDIACQQPMLAFLYAAMIDKKPLDQTRSAACQSPLTALRYAQYVDCCPRDDTRKAACSLPWTAFVYASQVDGKPNEETRLAASSDPKYKKEYEDFEKALSEWLELL
jgi:hypothetical protein